MDTLTDDNSDVKYTSCTYSVQYTYRNRCVYIRYCLRWKKQYTMFEVQLSVNSSSKKRSAARHFFSHFPNREVWCKNLIFFPEVKCIYHYVPVRYHVCIMNTLLGTNISPKNGILKMIFLFPRWDMLISWRVYTSVHLFIYLLFIDVFVNLIFSCWTVTWAGVEH